MKQLCTQCKREYHCDLCDGTGQVPRHYDDPASDLKPCPKCKRGLCPLCKYDAEIDD